MPLITKPDFTYVWASGGAVVAPNDTKKQLGWVAEAPPFQYDNWLQNRQDQMLAHINQRGIPGWDGLTNYEAGGLSYVQGSDGKVHKSVAASGPSATVQNPTTDVTDTYWTIAFADVGAFLTQTAGDTRYTQRSNNLSDLTNVTTARTNLGAAPLASPPFTGTPTAPTAITGTNTTQIATTAFVQAQLASSVPAATVSVAGKVELATNAETQAGTDTTRAVTPANLNSTVLGMGQTWQNMLGSRVAGTTYTNSTGRSICVSATINSSAGSPSANSITLTVGGVTAAQGTYYAGNVNQGGAVFAVVPPGATYSISISAGSIPVWAELR